MSQEQRLFWQWITQPKDLSKEADDIAALLAPHSHLSQAQALSIYNNAYYQRLIEISSSIFPVLYHSLGESLYAQVFVNYLQEYPPRHGPINRVGDYLADYLLLRPEFRNIPAAADIARLEMLLNELFDCADETSFHMGALYALPTEQWGQMIWYAKQDWALMYSRFKLEDYWKKMHQYIADKGSPGEADFGIEPLEHTSNRDPNYLVYRKDHVMQFQAISPTLSFFLMQITQQLNFADICSALAERFPEEDTAALSLSLLLKSIEMGLIRGPNQA
ncbi:MAG: putative DNA-binding domain-containing protein [Pseudohongiellaceae bacterium]|nr:putative DNA-binding domain-containing protein [Pseudohongiellaceae bacterium]